MHQRMIPYLYPVLEIYKQVFPWERNSQGLDLEKYERAFFQEDGSKDSLSIFDIAKDLRILPKPWMFLRCSLARQLAERGNPRNQPQDQNRHTRILEAYSLIARQAFSKVSPGRLNHFTYVF